MRSSVVNIGCLWCGLPTTPTTTRSNIPAARVITSTWPFVTGSYEPGQIAVITSRAPRRRRLPPGEAGLRRRLTTLAAGCCVRSARSYSTYCPSRRSLASFASAVRGTRVAVHRHARLAVLPARALVEWKPRLGAHVGLVHEHAVVAEDAGEIARELRFEVGVQVVRRVDEHEIVLRPLGGEHGDRVAPQHGRLQAQLVEVALDRAHCVAVRLDEDGARRPARERLEAERARAGVQIEHGRPVDGPEDVEHVLAHAVGRRPGLLPLRSVDRVPFPRTGDDAHRWQRTPSSTARGTAAGPGTSSAPSSKRGATR